ncbi:hypothetical protein [Embleya hyalina]|uniref:Uncharacterized protein n=1 Tax=Embleya hyalina TaxID=516124 RepID=A0A401YQT5_9ACTN|nr:hypothetical protein [Embleya hyalina]GCD96953.1 hypothetical protein EHYA_04640 [Embleya hyalina]
MLISFSAWRDSTHIPLAEILLRLGSRGLVLEWSCDIEEITPGHPHAPKLETLSSRDRISTLGLLSLITPDTRVINGRVEGATVTTGETVLSIEALHCSRWHIETSDPEVLDLFATTYPLIPRASTTRNAHSSSTRG